MSFSILQPTFDPDLRQAIFAFEIAGHQFEEQLVFPEGFDKDAAFSDEFIALLNLTACALGTSYYKLLAPLNINIPDFPLSDLQQELVLDLYENGLGEFYATNNLARFGKLRISVQTAALKKTNPPKPKSGARSLLLVGGGKDSNVSALLLAQNHMDFTPFAVNPKGPISTSIDAMDKTPLYIQRHLDKHMIALSKQAGYYNGHVPSTAINSLIAALSACLFGYQNIILSNERSASEGNVIFNGRTVNHQHSKSYRFEQLLAKTLSQTTNGRRSYFSLLRPFSELKIAKLFARSNIFDTRFSSCNTNFRQGKNSSIHWCNACPKCHFVYLMFAPFMPEQRLKNIFNASPLDNHKNLSSFKNLTGLGEQKPWECVGETIEAAAALYSLRQMPHFSKTQIVQSLCPELRAQYGEKKLIAAFAKLLKDSDEHIVPSQFLPALATP